MQLKEAIGAKFIMRQATRLSELAMDKLGRSKNIVFLGNKHLPHLPTYSMVIKHTISGGIRITNVRQHDCRFLGTFTNPV